MTAENFDSLSRRQRALVKRKTRAGRSRLPLRLFCVLLSVVLGMGLAMAVVENSARFVPSYEKLDLTPIWKKRRFPRKITSFFIIRRG